MSRFVRTFQPRFSRLVESGAKRQTIRKTPKRMPKVGDTLDAREWTGAPYRSKQRKLLEAPLVSVSEVEIFTKCVKVNGALIRGSRGIFIDLRNARMVPRQSQPAFQRHPPKMVELRVTLCIDESPWTDAKDAPNGVVARIARIPNGTRGGLSSVSVMIELGNGQKVIGLTTLALLSAAVAAFNAEDKRRAALN